MEKWVIKNRKADFEHIKEKFHICEATARCIVNRGYSTDEEIEGYLHPNVRQLYPPELLKDVNKACALLKDKIGEGKAIRIIGDYDVDGIVATYLLYSCLSVLGAKVDYRIPHRMLDGYGVNDSMVEEAISHGIDTIITCDNGIAAIKPVELAKNAGLTVIVTDHHNLVELEDGNVVLPNADAVINPKQSDCEYPFKGICGAMVAYKLMLALSKGFSTEQQERVEELFPFTAIATVCDVMDLVDENRIVVSCGLKSLSQTEHYGLRALMDITGIEPHKLSSFHLGFIIGPCLNASGRMDTALKGLELLLAESREKATILANEVVSLNNKRKDLTELGTQKAIELVLNSDLVRDKVLVVYLPDCHESLAGIIAGRLREKFYKPAIVLTDAETGLKGSARAIEDYDMFVELCKCRDLLVKFGGHKMAAGMSLEREHLNELRMRLNREANLTDEMLRQKVTIDAVLPLGMITEQLIEELKTLEPFGKENNKPLFAEKNLLICKMSIIGKNGNVLRLTLENRYRKKMEAVYFGDVSGFVHFIEEKYGVDEIDKLKLGRYSEAKITVAYYPVVNEYNGRKSLQIILQNYC